MTEKRMKILHVLTDRNIGGAGRWLLYYLKYHNREKFAVKVVLPHDSLLVAAVQALDVPVLAMEEMEDKLSTGRHSRRWRKFSARKDRILCIRMRA